MKNYYEILEVDKNASQEVIEKAYKVLAKKYHPDLEQGEKQKEYTEKIKIINQAYEILSDNFKRAEYDEKLKNEELQKKVISTQYSNNREYKHEFKYYLKAILIFLIIAFISFLIYQIPPVKEYFQNLYNENVVFQAIIDIIKNTFSAKF